MFVVRCSEGTHYPLIDLTVVTLHIIVTPMMADCLQEIKVLEPTRLLDWLLALFNSMVVIFKREHQMLLSNVFLTIHRMQPG